MKWTVLSFLLLLTACRAPLLVNTDQFVPLLNNPCELRDPDDPAARELAAFCTQLPESLAGMRVLSIHRLAGHRDIEEQPAGDILDGFVVSSSAEVNAAQSGSGVLQQSLRRIVSSRTDGSAMCFTPRHAVVLLDGDQRITALVCFECRNYLVVKASAQWPLQGDFDGDEQELWERFFARAGIALN